MESKGEEIQKDVPESAKVRKPWVRRLWGPALVGASILAGLAGKADTGNKYSPDTTTPSETTANKDSTATDPALTKEASVPIEEEKKSVPFENIFQGLKSLYRGDSPSLIVVSNQEDFENNWKMFNDDPNRPIPEVDFSQKTILIVTQGMSSGGRNMIEVTDVKEEKNLVDVEVTSTFPDAACPLLQQEASPFQAIVVPKLKTDKVSLQTIPNSGCFDIGYATSSRLENGRPIYFPPTVTKEAYEPNN